MTDSLAQIVRANLNRPEVELAMTAFYAGVDAAIARRQPVCRNRGACCQFDRFGHLLYVTSLELIHFVQEQRPAWRRACAAGGCPYHAEGKCLARPHRPLGCRVFFCDPETRDWQQTEYEQRQGELRKLGATFGVDYRYVEWLSALREIGPAIFQPSTSAPAGLTPSTGV